MYESFYGLNEPAFRLTPNPRFLVPTPRHREALSNLHYAIAGRKGISLLLGEAGTGKTTLLRATLQEHQREASLCVYLDNPALTRAEFVEALAEGFGLGEAARVSKTRLLADLRDLLAARRDDGQVTVLIIDEAQSMPPELLEEVRLLGNIDQDGEPLLPLVLAGQPEFAERLNERQFRQLKQRICLRCSLTPLTLEETRAYVATRIARAGGNAAALFTREAVDLVHAFSGGIPRTISVVCDNALLGGFALGRKPIGTDIVREVCGDFDLRPVAPVPAAPAARPAASPGRSHGSAPDTSLDTRPDTTPVNEGRPTTARVSGGPDEGTLPKSRPADPARASSTMFAVFGRRRFSWF